MNFYGNRYGQVYKGYFLAPKTGDYIFRGAADDNFALYISDNYGTATINPTPYIYADSAAASTTNLYISNQTTAHGAPRYMEEGKYYYMEAYHVNVGGTGFFSIEVEVPNTDSSLHWQSYEVNQLELSFTNDPEIMEFTLEGFNATVGGTFMLRIVTQDPDTLEYDIQETEIDWDATASEFAQALNAF